MTLDTSEYLFDVFVRKPFQIVAIEVTTANIEALAEHVGELKEKNGTPYILSDKKLVGKSFNIWPGFFITMLNDKVRCYSPRVFREQFIELSAVSDAVEAIDAAKVVRQKERLFDLSSNVVENDIALFRSQNLVLDEFESDAQVESND